ncbi:MAG: chemotaxis protein chel [Rhodobacteraceae bacterium]|nr:chemotaxis protein chel [Paracoccaceae bacterium]
MPAGKSGRKDDPMFVAAQKFEASFIAEMLKSTGAGKPRDSFNGGAGEDGFSSFLVELRAEKIVDGGGFGLTEVVFEALKRSEAENDRQS